MEVTGQDYLKCCEVLEGVASKLAEAVSIPQDFLDVYNFLFYVYRRIKEVPSILKGVRSFRDNIEYS